MKIKVIVACDENGSIGKQNGLPWKHIAEEMKYFTDQTLGHAVIMGRSTWESLPARHRPLKGRFNVVLTKNPNTEIENAATTIQDALDMCAEHQVVWCIGGEKVYEAFFKGRVDEAHVSHIRHSFDDCDAKFTINLDDYFQDKEHVKTIRNDSYDIDIIKYSNPKF